TLWLVYSGFFPAFSWVFLISVLCSRAGWAANRSLNFLFTVRTGTTRMRHRTMAECASARSDNGQNHAFPACCPGSCWAEPPINGGQNGWSLGHESFPGALRSSTPFALPSRALHHGVDNSRHRDLSRFGFALAFCCCLRFGSWANLGRIAQSLVSWFWLVS